MNAFLAAVAAAIIVAVGAIYVLDAWQRPVDQAYASTTGTRIPDHGTIANLVGRDWQPTRSQ